MAAVERRGDGLIRSQCECLFSIVSARSCCSWPRLAAAAAGASSRSRPPRARPDTPSSCAASRSGARTSPFSGPRAGASTIISQHAARPAGQPRHAPRRSALPRRLDSPESVFIDAAAQRPARSTFDTTFAERRRHDEGHRGRQSDRARPTTGLAADDRAAEPDLRRLRGARRAGWWAPAPAPSFAPTSSPQAEIPVRVDERRDAAHADRARRRSTSAATSCVFAQSGRRPRRDALGGRAAAASSASACPRRRSTSSATTCRRRRRARCSTRIPATSR